MDANFPAALDAVFAVEGGYSDDPRDPGGPTRFGVTQATLARARGRPVSAEEVKALGRDEAADIYRHLYWDAVRGDELPAGVDLAVFDGAVNAGPRRAVLLLQKALGVQQDGVIGPLTLEAALGADPSTLISRYSAARLAWLRSLPGWKTFGRGWSRRVAEIERRALALAAPPAPKPEPPRVAAAPSLPSKTQEKSMDMIKPILQSRTVWSNLIGLAAIGLSAFGFDTTGVDQGRLAEAGLQAIAGLSFVSSTVFRILATRRLV